MWLSYDFASTQRRRQYIRCIHWSHTFDPHSRLYFPVRPLSRMWMWMPIRPMWGGGGGCAADNYLFKLNVRCHSHGALHLIEIFGTPIINRLRHTCLLCCPPHRTPNTVCMSVCVCCVCICLFDIFTPECNVIWPRKAKRNQRRHGSACIFHFALASGSIDDDLCAVAITAQRPCALLYDTFFATRVQCRYRRLCLCLCVCDCFWNMKNVFVAASR